MADWGAVYRTDPWRKAHIEGFGRDTEIETLIQLILIGNIYNELPVLRTGIFLISIHYAMGMRPLRNESQ